MLAKMAWKVWREPVASLDGILLLETPARFTASEKRMSGPLLDQLTADPIGPENVDEMHDILARSRLYVIGSSLSVDEHSFSIQSREQCIFVVIYSFFFSYIANNTIWNSVCLPRQLDRTTDSSILFVSFLSTKLGFEFHLSPPLYTLMVSFSLRVSNPQRCRARVIHFFASSYRHTIQYGTPASFFSPSLFFLRFLIIIKNNKIFLYFTTRNLWLNKTIRKENTPVSSYEHQKHPARPRPLTVINQTLSPLLQSLLHQILTQPPFNPPNMYVPSPAAKSLLVPPIALVR